MKILQVLSTLVTGGAESFTVGLTNELIRQGYDCDLVTLFDIDKDNDLLKILSSKSNFNSLHKKSGFDLKCYWRLYKYIKRGGYNIVHAHVGAIPYILLSSILLRKVKFVATIHSEAKREAGKNIKKWSRIFMFRHKKCIPVTISEQSKLSFDDFYQMNAPMVNNGVSDYQSCGIPPLRDNDNQILFIHPASCQPVKNQELLIRAFAKLVLDYPNSKLIWLGSNSSHKVLFESLEPLMPKQFLYYGTVPNVRDYMAQADAICLSSKMEGMPMTIIESFSVGTPAICTAVGGIINMIENGKNGLLSTSLTVDDYYNIMKQFCDLSSSERIKMKQFAKESFSRYSIENTAKGYLEIYKTF